MKSRFVNIAEPIEVAKDMRLSKIDLPGSFDIIEVHSDCVILSRGFGRLQMACLPAWTLDLTRPWVGRVLVVKRKRCVERLWIVAGLCHVEGYDERVVLREPPFCSLSLARIADLAKMGTWADGLDRSQPAQSLPQTDHGYALPSAARVAWDELRKDVVKSALQEHLRRAQDAVKRLEAIWSCYGFGGEVGQEGGGQRMSR